MKRKKEFDEENEIDLEIFLLGGTTGNPYNRVTLEGFHYITKEADLTFEEFKETVLDLVSRYCWDTNACMTVSIPRKSDDALQGFFMPNDKELKRLYKKAKRKSE